MSIANKTIKIVILLLSLVCVTEAYLIYANNVNASHLLEADAAAIGLSNAGVLAEIRHDVAAQQYDNAVRKLDLAIKHAVDSYRRKKRELRIELPGEAKSLDLIRQHDPTINLRVEQP